MKSQKNWAIRPKIPWKRPSGRALNQGSAAVSSAGHPQPIRAGGMLLPNLPRLLSDNCRQRPVLVLLD